MVHKNHPEFHRLTAESNAFKQRIKQAVFEAWNELDDDFTETPVRSMP